MNEIDISIEVLEDLIRNILFVCLQEISELVRDNYHSTQVIEWARKNAVKINNSSVLYNKPLLVKNSASFYRFANQLVRELNAMGFDSPTLQKIKSSCEAFGSIERQASSTNWFSYEFPCDIVILPL